MHRSRGKVYKEWCGSNPIAAGPAPHSAQMVQQPASQLLLGVTLDKANVAIVPTAHKASTNIYSVSDME
jgi:hypothetical protein